MCADGSADGYEYAGSWKDDEMNGDFMTVFVFGMKEDKVLCALGVSRSDHFLFVNLFFPHTPFSSLGDASAWSVA